MDGFALRAAETPGEFATRDRACAWAKPRARSRAHGRRRFQPAAYYRPAPTRSFRSKTSTYRERRCGSRTASRPARTSSLAGADMRRGETILRAGTRIAAPQAGVLATLGVVDVPVYRRPVVGVLSSGDELVAASARPTAGRDTRFEPLRNRGVAARHGSATAPLSANYRRTGGVRKRSRGSTARLRCRGDDAVVPRWASATCCRPRSPPWGSGRRSSTDCGSSPGSRLLLGALANRPIFGLPGNPASALLVMEGVSAPIVAALVGAPVTVPIASAVLAEPLRGRLGWTWYVPVALRHEGETVTAHPLPLRSFSMSLAARADGYVVTDEREAERPAGAVVTVRRFLGG